MSFNKRTLFENIFKITKTTNRNTTTTSLTNCRISTSAVSVPTRIAPNHIKPDPEPGDDNNSSSSSGMFPCRRLFHKIASTHLLRTSPANSTEIRRMLPVGEKLMEQLGSLEIVSKERLRLDGIGPPASREVVTVEGARKLLMAAQVEAVKMRVREVGKSWIAYSDFVGICREVCSDPGRADQVAKALDESGSVIVLGNVVSLNPQEVVKAMQGIIPLPQITKPGNQNDPRWKELQELENQKLEIDKKADSLVRRELWCGLGFLLVQTAGFMRLTFWELSWDVMEPICFYVTSIYCMVGYAFFLRTSKEPSFEGFYQSRFVAKQKQLIKAQDFDLERYVELRNACYPTSQREQMLMFDRGASIC